MAARSRRAARPCARQLLIESFPEAVRQRLSRFEERQWHIAAPVARCAGASDLVDSNPALAWMVASSWCFKRAPVRQPLRSARRLLARPQADITGWLDLPATRSTVSILRKVPPAACRMAILLPLAQLLRGQQALGMLRHVRRVNGTVVAVLREEGLRSLVSPRLLADLVQSGGEASAAAGVGLLRDTRAMLDHLHLERRGPFQSLSSLRRCHDECVNRMAQADVGEDIALPPPPLEGTPTIQPLRSHAALLAEGRLQRNCVGAYAPMVTAGLCYVYRIEAPQRATLAIEPGPGGWQVRELAGYANSAVPSHTWDSVDRWLRGG